jgi:cobalt-zinc-cadmium efflux system membrane fusion protein
MSSSISHHRDIASAPSNPSPPVSGRVANVWRWFASALPTAAVIAALGALAYWGHHTGWTIPKFSALVGQEEPEVGAWCDEHNVAESACIECNPSLLPPVVDYGWCKIHGISQCPFEHPEVAQTKTPVAISQADLDRANRALAVKPRIENNPLCQLHLRRVQFASAAAAEKVGVDIAVVQQRPIVESVVANGEVVYDQTRVAPLSSRLAGTVWRVEKLVGQQVRKGEVLALIDAAEVGRAKSELLQAIAQARLRDATTERLRPLAQDAAVAAQRFREAQASQQEAQIRLLAAQQALVNLGLPLAEHDFSALEPEEIARQIQFLGLLPELVAGLDSRLTSSNLLPLVSPIDGIIVERSAAAVAGKVVDTSDLLFTVADVSQMWLMLNVREEDARFLTLGQPVFFRHTNGQQEPEHQGTVGWISTAADDQTRTVRVRVDLPNADGHLRANTFGTGRIVLREEPKAIVVPSEAVHSDGNCQIVFVRDKNYLQADSPKFFYVRSVRTGVNDGDGTEIIAGLVPGEVIASKNSVVLEAQLLKGNLGAGCGCVDGH